jgi:hypothetical protein
MSIVHKWEVGVQLSIKIISSARRLFVIYQHHECYIKAANINVKKKHQFKLRVNDNLMTSQKPQKLNFLVL